MKILISQILQMLLNAYLVVGYQDTAQQENHGLIDEVLNQNQCGGPLEADMDSLTYPRPGQTVQPGEMCVWTIHLQTTKSFRLSLPNINLNSSSNCGDGSIRIYSLTNLVSTENLESYTFCNEMEAPEYFYLIENVVTVVFFAGSNPLSSTGFTLEWAGTAFNPIPTTHITSYSTSSSGLIRYPLEGEYELSTIATWLVKAGRFDQQLNLHLNLTSLSLEACANADDICVCDALILYDITDFGVLRESRRFCGETPSAVVEGLEANFVVAFFSDFNSISGTGNGFELQYKPIVDDVTTTTTSTTTTTTSTTTTNVPVRPSTPCGSIIELEVAVDDSAEGRIFYKPDENYSANERCVWLIRSNVNNLEVELEEAGFESPRDKVLIDSFNYGGSGDTNYSDPFLGTTVLTTRSVGMTNSANASVAIITFVTSAESSGLGKGFVLRYSSNFINGEVVYDYSLGDVITDALWDTYTQDREDDSLVLTFYVLPPTGYQFHPELKKDFYLTSDYMEQQCTGIDRCCDSLRVYYLTVNGLVNVEKYCGTNIQESFESSDTLVLVYKTDYSWVSRGFTVQWNTSLSFSSSVMKNL